MGLLRIDPGCCQRICDLPNDLLLRILIDVPTKDALSTSILSKRWRYVSKMLPELTFKDDDQGDSDNLGLFIDKSLQLHKAPKLQSLVVELGPRCLVDVDFRKWVEKAVNHGLKKLDFKLLLTTEPTSFPMSLYTCDTLVRLTLSNNILVDVSFHASLPSLLYLDLFFILYKDEDSLARLLSSCPVLEQLEVERHDDQDDNLTNVTVKVPSLTLLRYTTSWRKDVEEEEHSGSLVIDSPALTICDNWGDYCSLTSNMPCLDELACHKAAKFSRLVDLFFIAEDGVHWLELLIFFLQNSPILKKLLINTAGCPQSSWNQPSTIVGCLSSHLEIVRWQDYEGKEDDKQVMTYILANSKCLKTMAITLTATCNIEKCHKELESMPRISPSSRLLYSTPEADWDFR